MTAQEFYKKYGRKVVREVCDKVGIREVYWNNIKNLHTTVSVHRALELAKASYEVTGDPMTVVDLLRLRDLPPTIVGSARGDK
jgi:hypothetical protein